jgi:hypothetical protein
MTYSRFRIAAIVTAVAAVAVTSIAALSHDGTSPEITVYKSPTCGCCSKWIEHLEATGFAVTAVDVADLRPIKVQHGVTPDLASCHTAVVGQYVIEGHVPGDVIRRLLEEAPEVAGLAVPGMPMGSPGMEGAYAEPYNVLAFDRDGNVSVFAAR